MPRYYFDIRDHRGVHSDEFGDDLADMEEVRHMCQCLLPDLMREELPDGDSHSVSCQVRDEAGRIVYRGEITYRGAQDRT